MNYFRRAKEYVDHGITKCDMYGSPVSFTFNHQSTYKSCFGGCVSIISVIIIVIYIVLFMTEIVSRDKVIVTNSEYFWNYIFDTQSFDLTQDKFDLAAMIIYRGPNLTIWQERIETYFSLRIVARNLIVYDVPT